MIELIVFFLALGADWLLKDWSMRVLAHLPGQTMDLIPGVIWLRYAENYGKNIGIRSRGVLNTLVKLAVLALIIYLLVRKRKQLAGITRASMALYAAGMLGNQLNYWRMNFVPDMFELGFFRNRIFNLADVYILVALLILIVRLLFFEGRSLTDSLAERNEKIRADERKLP